MRKLFSVVDSDGHQTQAVESIGNGEVAIAREFGISASNLVNYQTKRRNSKSFMAYQSAAGLFREIVSTSRG